MKAVEQPYNLPNGRTVYFTDDAGNLYSATGKKISDGKPAEAPAQKSPTSKIQNPTSNIK
jgi:hypothetical protein